MYLYIKRKTLAQYRFQTGNSTRPHTAEDSSKAYGLVNANVKRSEATLGKMRNAIETGSQRRVFAG